MHASHLHVVEQLDARDRDAELHRQDHRLHAPRAGRGNWHTAAEIASGMP